jgi:UDP-glucose 4-epimerase
MKCLVTGGAGFIGSHLAQALIARGSEVVILDDLSTGRAENIASLLGHPRVSIVHGSILDGDLVDHHTAGCAHIYHLAAAVGVKLIFDHPVRTIETNVHGTESVLRAARKHGSRVLIASTSEVYGKDPRNRGGQFGEGDDLTLGTSLRWGYAASKALDEYLGRAYHREYGVPVVVVRLFNTVGPRQTGAYGMVLPRLVRQALEGRPLTVYGDGSQVRVFLWVGDAVTAVAGLMKHPEAEGKIFNVGGVEPITIKDLAIKVKELTGSPSEIVFIPYERAYGPGFEDIRYRVPDITKLKRLLAFQPTKSLDDVIREVASQYSQDGWRPRLEVEHV